MKSFLCTCQIIIAKSMWREKLKGKKKSYAWYAGYWFGENEDPLVYEDNIFCGWLSMSSVRAIENAYNSLTSSPNPQNSLFCHAFYRQNVCSKSGKDDPREPSSNEGWGSAGGDWRCSLFTQGCTPYVPIIRYLKKKLDPFVAHKLLWSYPRDFFLYS